MNKKEATIKVKKILALANDKAATPEEKDTALNLARRIASKYNLKVEKKQPVDAGFKFTEHYANDNLKEYKQFTFTPKNPSSKFIRILNLIMCEAGYTVVSIKNGKSYIGFTYINTVSVNTSLTVLYKECFFYCNDYKTFLKLKTRLNYTSNKMTDEFCDDVLHGAYGLQGNATKFTNVRDISLNFGKRIITTLQRYKGGQ